MYLGAMSIPEVGLLGAPAHTESLYRWEIPFRRGCQTPACVLTRNAVLVATARPHHRDSAQDILGKLATLNRADGTRTWEVDLPARAIYDGLSVAADGRVLCIATPSDAARAESQSEGVEP